MFLAIDTSAGTSVAVVDGRGAVLSESSVADTMRHAEVVGSLIAECLREARVESGAIEAVVAGMGPGPFTGLRVGIAAARAFAFARGIPVIPVVSHDAIAAREYDARGVRPIVVVTDARRRELYWSAYAGDQHTPRTRGLTQNLPGRGEIESLDSEMAGLIPKRERGPGLAKPDAMSSLVPDGAERIDAREVSAGMLARIAWARRTNGIPADADEPLYLRSPDVTPSHATKRVS